MRREPGTDVINTPDIATDFFARAPQTVEAAPSQEAEPTNPTALLKESLSKTIGNLQELMKSASFKRLIETKSAKEALIISGYGMKNADGTISFGGEGALAGEIFTDDTVGPLVEAHIAQQLEDLPQDADFYEKVRIERASVVTLPVADGITLKVSLNVQSNHRLEDKTTRTVTYSVLQAEEPVYNQLAETMVNSL
jgi:hypothetical protein